MTANYDELFSASQKFLKTPWFASKGDLQNFISIIDAMPRDLTLFEMFYAMEEQYSSGLSNFLYDYDYSYSTVGRMLPAAADVMTSIYPLWVDKESILERPDNFMSEFFTSDDDSEWNKRYLQDMFTLVTGPDSYLSSYTAGHLGGNQSYETDIAFEPVAAFNLKEHSWSEFQDTFDDEANQYMHSGVIVELLNADFVPSLRVWKGSITKGIQVLRRSS